MNKKVEKTQLNASRCLCLDCPSYALHCKTQNAAQTITLPTQNLQQRNHYEKMFCAFEKSHCIRVQRGCLCDNCANYHNYNLNKHSWCLYSNGLN